MSNIKTEEKGSMYLVLTDAAAADAGEFKSVLSSLGESEIKFLAALHLNTGEEGKINWDSVAREVDSKSADSCRVRYRTLKKKIESGRGAPAGGIKKDSSSKVKTATPKKATPKKKKDAENGDAPDSPSTPKKRSRMSKKEKEARDAALTAAIKAEEPEEPDKEVAAEKQAAAEEYAEAAKEGEEAIKDENMLED